MVVVNLCIRFDNANFTVRIMSYVDVIYGCHVHDLIGVNFMVRIVSYVDVIYGCHEFLHIIW